MTDRTRRPNESPGETPCTAREEALALHVGGDLSPEEARELEHHLSGCSRCTAFLRQLGETRSVLRTLTDPPPGDSVTGVHRRVMEAVRREASGRRSQISSPPAWRWAAAAALLLIVGAALVGRLALRSGAPEEAPVTVVVADPRNAVPGAAAGTDPSHPIPGRTEEATLPEESRSEPGQEADDDPSLPPPEGRHAPAPPAPLESHSPQPEIQRTGLDDAPDLKIKLVSDDPDIVIYWLVETRTEETLDATPTT